MLLLLPNNTINTSYYATDTTPTSCDTTYAADTTHTYRDTINATYTIRRGSNRYIVPGPKSYGRAHDLWAIGVSVIKKHLTRTQTSCWI